ncbi:unnamed protein product, partial [marine sediment metagenome]
AHLVLEGSDQHEWGVVKDCHGNINLIPDDAEVVGTWNKYAEGTFWVSLETPIQALQDKATLLIAELAKKRAEELVHLPTRKRSLPKEPTGPSTSDRLEKLRAKITGQ